MLGSMGNKRLWRQCVAALATLVSVLVGTVPAVATTRGTPATHETERPHGFSPGSRPKSPLTGLIDMGNQTPYQQNKPFPTTDPAVLDPYAGAFAGIVVNESWSQLEPSPGHEDWAPLVASLAAVQTWNRRHPSTPLAVKLRVFAGSSAPGWVVRRSGPPVTIISGKHDQRTQRIGRWWKTPFRTAWSRFQHALAAHFDSNPLIRAVSVSSCSSSTGEPFNVSINPTSRTDLLAAGWTVQAQEACLRGALADYSGWKLTPVTFAFNPLPVGRGFDQAFTTTIMEACANSLASGGPNCVLGNNGLRIDAPTSRVSGPLYAEIDRLVAAKGAHPPAVYLQTVGFAVDCRIMAVASAYHASSVELWPPYDGFPGFSAIPRATLTTWDRDLISRHTITC
jgi:hypothetical protein